MSSNPVCLNPENIQRRNDLREQLNREHCTRVDRLFVALMVVQFVCGIVAACLISPKTWIGQTSHVHIHIWAAFLLGGLISGGPIVAVWLNPGSQQSRLMMAVSQGLWSALLIHLSGGRLETHFHVFGSLAFVAFYRDWKVLVATTVVITMDHALRGIWWPLSVYGLTTASPYRWLEHAAWVIFEDIFLMFNIMKSQQDVSSVCDRQAELESLNSDIEETVRRRTIELETARADAERLALVAKYTDNSVIILNSLGRVEWVNDGFTRITGYRDTEVIGHSPIEVLRGPSTREETVTAMLDGVKNQRPFDVEVHKRRKDGREISIQIEMRPIFDKDEQFVGMIQIGRDVTAAREAERERARLNEELRAAARVAGRAEIATGVLHNVGNALNSINVAAGVLRESLSGSSVVHLEKASHVIEEHADDLGKFLTVDPQGKHFPTLLGELSNQLLAERTDGMKEVQTLMESIENIKDIVASHETFAGQKECREPIDLVKLTDTALAMQDEAFKRHQIHVVTRFQHVPPVRAIRQRVLDVLTILLTNAKEAMSKSSLDNKQLTVSIETQDDSVSIAVIDQGVGISNEELGMVFKPGFTNKSGGHGFGLHSSAITAADFGGSLSAQSDGPGCGATFVLRLPTISESVPERTE
ncbi:PAS domain S-box protein [Fuerstiella marisgermanici]|uniref:histidine kinase n=1 Tax=Fuerstiella marisgermanici TaxID=1891926 RepID=A0A1P8WN58_9PLAN|nr:PAS domain-containing protein [Fuerstiella marisgermanici]APZ95481.1 Sensor protein FixL [Fuerstiella marisgermanici]